MPRTHPTKQIGTIGHLAISPERGVRDYLESMQETRFLVKHPNWDSAGDSIELMFIRNEREHAAMLRLQREMLDNSQRHAMSNMDRAHKMAKMQSNLRKRFIKVNGFIKECRDKKELATKKVNAEKEKHKQLRKEIRELRNGSADLDDFRRILSRTVAKFEKYERVMQDVVKVSDIFEDVKDCTDRCDALMMAQVEITGLEAKTLQEIEEMRKRMLLITNEAALTVLGLKNALAELERSYVAARNECIYWEKTLANAKDYVAKNNLTKGHIVDGINYTYRLLCKRRKKAHVFKQHEVEKQLDYILKEVEILRAVLRKCNELYPTKVKAAFLSDKTIPHC